MCSACTRVSPEWYHLETGVKYQRSPHPGGTPAAAFAYSLLSWALGWGTGLPSLISNWLQRSGVSR